MKKTSYKIQLRALERYADPRCCQVDLYAPWAKVSRLLNREDEPDRVMPIRNLSRFIDSLRKSTRTFSGVDTSHFWVSGYYAIYFQSSRVINRKAAKLLVKKAVGDTGGFMTAEEWCAARGDGTSNRTFGIAAGSGSNIAFASNFNPAFL